MKLNKLASVGAFLIIIAQISALTFATIDLTKYYSFNWLGLPSEVLFALNCVIILLALIDIITTMISMFKMNTDIKALAAWLAIMSIAGNWYPYFFPAIFTFTGAILLLAGKYKPVSVIY